MAVFSPLLIDIIVDLLHRFSRLRVGIENDLRSLQSLSIYGFHSSHQGIRLFGIMRIVGRIDHQHVDSRIGQQLDILQMYPIIQTVVVTVDGLAPIVVATGYSGSTAPIRATEILEYLWMFMPHDIQIPRTFGDVISSSHP